MKKNLVVQKTLSVNKNTTRNRQVEKYLALESHPRQKQQDSCCYHFSPSVVAMLF